MTTTASRCPSAAQILAPVTCSTSSAVLCPVCSPLNRLESESFSSVLFSACRSLTPTLNRYEHDGSITFDDGYFNAGGFTDQFNGTLWKARKASAVNDFGGLFNLDWVARESFFALEDNVTRREKLEELGARRQNSKRLSEAALIHRGFHSTEGRFDSYNYCIANNPECRWAVVRPSPLAQFWPS